jgi:hypothetical protein
MLTPRITPIAHRGPSPHAPLSSREITSALHRLSVAETEFMSVEPYAQADLPLRPTSKEQHNV